MTPAALLDKAHEVGWSVWRSLEGSLRIRGELAADPLLVAQLRAQKTRLENLLVARTMIPDIREELRRRGWPPLVLEPWASIGSGEENWQVFLATCLSRIECGAPGSDLAMLSKVAAALGSAPTTAGG